MFFYCFVFFQINTCDQNVARCCEIVELNAKVQGQLFKLLSLTAESGRNRRIFTLENLELLLT